MKPADITLMDGVVRLDLPLDAPPDFVRVDGFNIPDDGDARTCDSVLGIADPFSTQTPPGRFQPMLTAPGDPFTIQPSPSDGTLFERGDEQLPVRVLDACSVNDPSGSASSVAPSSRSICRSKTRNRVRLGGSRVRLLHRRRRSSTRRRSRPVHDQRRSVRETTGLSVLRLRLLDRSDGGGRT